MSETATLFRRFARRDDTIWSEENFRDAERRRNYCRMR